MQHLARIVLGSLGAIEAVLAEERMNSRVNLYQQALQRSSSTRRPLVVIGDPDGGTHTRMVRAYGYGDLCVDLTGCPASPNGVAVDITRERVPVRDDSVIVYCSCVLEYVSDPYVAWAEMVRIAGNPENIFLVTVQQGSFTSVMYPGARWTILRYGSGIQAYPVTDEMKALTFGAVLAAIGFAL